MVAQATHRSAAKPMVPPPLFRLSACGGTSAVLCRWQHFLCLQIREYLLPLWGSHRRANGYPSWPHNELCGLLCDAGDSGGSCVKTQVSSKCIMCLKNINDWQYWEKSAPIVYTFADGKCVFKEGGRGGVLSVVILLSCYCFLAAHLDSAVGFIYLSKL